MRTGIKNISGLLYELKKNGYELDSINHTGENSFNAIVTYKHIPACNISIDLGGQSYIEDVEETSLEPKVLTDLSDRISPYTLSKRDQSNN
ncbi:Uncharacterised protein [uncultured archaeon]|nr:Uncharacterised protein [uncultured archaeon]